MSRPPAQAGLPAGFLSHVSLQWSEQIRGQALLLTEGGVLKETTQDSLVGALGLCGVAGPHPCCTGSPTQKGTGTRYMAGESRSPPLRTGSAPAATGGALEGPQSAPPVLQLNEAHLGAETSRSGLPLLQGPGWGGGGFSQSSFQLPAAPHPCPNLCPLFSMRLGCFLCPISRLFSPTFSVKSLQKSPSLVSEEPWAQGWSGLGQEKAGTRGQLERGTRLGTQQ